jgi:hypothetical protein
VRKTKAGHLWRIPQQGKTSKMEKKSRSRPLFCAVMLAQPKAIDCLPYRNVVGPSTMSCQDILEQRGFHYLSQVEPSGFEGVTPSRRKHFTDLRFLVSKVEQKSRLSLSSRVEPVKVSARSLSRKWGQAEEEGKKKPRTGGG